MTQLTTCLSPQLLPLHQIQDKIVVVVDILRATSSMVTAFAYNVESVTPVPTLADCRLFKNEGFVTAGERGGQKVEGFDLGNSPFDFMNHDLAGRHLAFTTTNGSQAIVLASEAKQVLIGSFLNLSATAGYLMAQKSPVLVLCAGWKGNFNIEDTLYAGALVQKLEANFVISDDASLAALTLYNGVARNMQEFLGKSSHAKRLAGFKNQKDLEFCLKRDQFDFNVVLQNTRLLKLDPST